MRPSQPLPLAVMLLVSMLSSATAEQSPPRPLFVEGYWDQLSYAPGDEAALHVSTTAGTFSVTIDRIGASDERVWEKTAVPGAEQEVPDNASSHGCQWPANLQLTIPEDWKSGYYQVTLHAEDDGGEFIGRNRRTATGSTFFVVRAADPGRDSKILLQLATNTYNAYTNWGGHSLYAYNGRNGLQGTRVSLDRPISSQFFHWEAPFIRWAEKSGFQIDYAVNGDLEFRPELLKHYRLVLSVGHDEYWSGAMRDHLEQFIVNGGNVAFFSGNTCCWQVRSENEGRALVCYKQSYNMDPLYRSNPSTLSTLWSHHLLNRPENELTGVGFLWGGYHRSHGQFMDGTGAYEVHRPEHWVYEGTGLKPGDSFGGEDTIVGYECDGCEFEMRDGLPVPTGRDGTPDSFVILGTCPARWAPGDSDWYERFPRDRVGAAVMGLYTRGGTVFTSGSTDWAHGLSGDDPVVQQITKNILNRLSR